MTADAESWALEAAGPAARPARYVGLYLRDPGNWFGTREAHWYRLPDRVLADPLLCFGALLAVPPGDDCPDGTIGWACQFSDGPAEWRSAPDALRVIPPREWDAHGFRNGLFYETPLPPAQG